MAAQEDARVDAYVASAFRVEQTEPAADAPNADDEDQQFADYMKANFPQATKGP